MGGGSAGSVLANRLSARSGNKVLLCEAGQDTPPGKVPAEILRLLSGHRLLRSALPLDRTEGHHRGRLPQQPATTTAPPLRKYEQARVLGGGSSINGQMANRGAPTDYDEWAARGAAGWGWDDVLPYFKKVERDLDFDGQWHGKDGRIPVRRISAEHCGRATPRPWPRRSRQAGYKFLPDQNGEFVDGYFPVTISNAVRAARLGRDRLSRCRAPASGDNLTISTDTQVTELLFEGTRCVGVKALVDGQATGVPRPRGHPVLAARSIRRRICCAPASARSGICATWASTVRAALAGVGQRLMDHPSIALSSFVKPRARVINEHTRRHIQLGLRYSSGLPGIAAGRHVRRRCINKSAWHAVGEQIGSLHPVREQDLFGNRPGEAAPRRDLARRAGGGVQPAVRPARPRPHDGRLPHDGGACR